MHISEINIYPIKSLKGISVDSAVVEERGLRHDRRWMLTTPDGMFLTQREFPGMATIAVEVNSDGLQVTGDNHGKMSIPFEPDHGDRGRVTVWNSVCDAEIYRGAVSEWFSDAIGANCQLVFMPASSRRGINPRFDRGNEVVSFADGYPLMVLSEASLEDLNSRLDDTFPMNRFRPNLVVSGAEAFAEDGWQKVRIGDAVFRSTKPCERCVITTVDQSLGEFAGKEPLKTLASYRMAKDVMPARFELLGINDTAVLFGQNLVPENPETIVRINDKVRIH